MLDWRRSIFLLLILCAVGHSGCRSSHAKSAPSQASSTPGQPPAPVTAKHAPRESALTIYHNPTYGISFRYPRNYLLHEASDSEDQEIREAQQQLASDQPGSTVVALVSIPPDAYPNTTFYSGTLQFVVDPTWTPEICVSSIIPNPLDAQDSIGTSTISGTSFHWQQSSELAQHRAITTRVYNAFVHGACYEFQLEVTTEPSFVPDFEPKPADSRKILHQLDKIVATLQIHPAEANVSLKPLAVTASPAP